MQEREAAAGTAADKEGVISSPHDSSRDGSPQDETGGDMGRQHDASTPNADPERNRLFHAALRKRLSKQHYDTWFRRTHVRHWGTGSMSFGVPNRFYMEWIQNKFHATVIQAASELAQAPMQVAFEVAALPDGFEEGGGCSEAPAPTPSEGETVAQPSAPEAPAAPPAPIEPGGYQPEPFVGSGPQDIPLVLNPHYTFKNFIRGPSNSVAYASAEAVANRPGRAYNPLFIHGSVGLGKTHLLHAVCRQFLTSYPRERVCFLSCEEFTNEFVRALQTGEHQRFRDRFRSVHLLVIDDIHFLEGKERTQEEFFHTFNQLYQGNRQIVVSSDAAPSEIPTLEDRLVSRFQWGLVTRLEQPETETRMAIVQRKAEIKGLALPNDVVEYIARNFRSNIRELEGALVSVEAYARATGQPVHLAMVEEALAASLNHHKQNLTMDKVVQSVINQYQVKLSDLRSKKRGRSISEPRQVAMFLCRQATNHSLEEIGDFFGGRDHSTVVYAIGRVETLLGGDDPKAQQVRRLMDRLGLH